MLSRSSRPRPADTVPLWRNRDFMLLWSGQVVSTVGIRMTALAYPLLVLAESGSPTRAGLVGFAQTLPFLLFYLPAGALVDWWDRKRVMVFSDAARGLVLSGVVGALALDRLTLAQVLVSAFMEGTLFVFFQLAESAALPHVVPAEQLPTALAQNQAREQGAELAGQPLGGLLLGISPVLPFLADAVSYVISICTLLLVRPRLQGDYGPSRRALLAEVGEGLRWLWRQHLLRVLVAFIGATNLVFNALTLVLIVRARDLGASPGLIGVLFALLGASAVVGSVIAPMVTRHLAAPTVIMGSLWLWAVQISALTLLGDVPSLAVAAATTALVGPAFNVVVAGYRYALAPDRLQARTQSAARLVAWGTIPLGTLLGGVLADAAGARPALLALGLGMTAIAAASTAMPHIRRAPNMADLPRAAKITPAEPARKDAVETAEGVAGGSAR